MSNIDVVYRDLNLDLKLHPITNDVMMKTNASDIKQSLKFLFSTNFYERPFNPSYGANIKRILFDLLDEYTLYSVESEIKQAIAKYEPRVELTSVSVVKGQSEGSVVITVNYNIVSVNISDTFVYTINRLR